MKRFLSVLLCAAMMLTLASAAFAAGLGLSTAPKSTPTSATLLFENADKRTVSEDGLTHVWQDNGVTFTAVLTNPSSSTTKIPTSVWPAQLTKGCTMTIEYPGMTYIEIICSTKTFATNYQKSITDTNVTTTVTNNVLLIQLPAAADSFTFDMTGGNGYAYGVEVHTGAETPTRTADQNASEFIQRMIDKIGTVTLESKDAITAARGFYTTLTDAQKAMVTNYETLTAAEAALKALGDQPAEAAVMSKSVAAFADDPRTYTKVYAQNGIAALVQKDPSGNAWGNYSSMGSGTTLTIVYPGMTKLVIESAVNNRGGNYVEAITAAFGALEGATVTADGLIVTVEFATARDYISVAPAKTIAMETLTISNEPVGPSEDEVAATAVAAQIEALGTVTLQSESAIKAARGAYDALTDAQKALVTNYETLTAAEGRLQELKKEAETPVVPAGDNAIMFFALAALSMTAMAVLVAKKREF